MPISAEAFDRLAEAGKDGKYAGYFKPIGAAEFRRELARSARR